MYFKITLDVPPGIRYLGDWSEFELSKFPGHCIIHKQLPGCGFTEYALRSNYPVVLCSPRKMLMQNKKDQHGDDVYLVVSRFDRDLDIDSDINKPRSVSEVKNIIEKELGIVLDKERNEEGFYQILFKEISDYLFGLTPGKFPKIIVTYDSAYLVKRVLEQMNLLNQFYFVIDEFQSLLEDAKFKADTEINFLTDVVPNTPNVLFVSATPMLDKYIEKIPELQCPYYQLDWGKLDPSRIKKPDLKVRTMSSISSKIEEIIQSYLEGNYSQAIVDHEGELLEIESKEAVFYVNSVNHIINAIQRNNLTPDQVNILCSNTPENQRKIDRKLGKKSGFQIGRVPLRGEEHKMFTFCTRTVYLGADFYSLCARSFIFSDSNSDCLSIDISMDLAQILGRQRLDENPWRNSAEFYYRATCDYKKMSYEDFRKIIESKEKESESLLRSWERALNEDKNSLAIKYQFIVRSLKYKDDYIAVNKLDDGKLVPVINTLVRINDERTFDIQQIDYRDRFSVFCSIKNQFSSIGVEGDILFNFFSQYDQLTTYVDKARKICEFIIENPSLGGMIINNLSDSDKIKQQLISIGPERIMALGYNLTRINKDMGITIFDRSTLDSVIRSTFLVGERYTKKWIKESLQNIYSQADFQGSAKAIDLENWFEIKEVRISIDGKREGGYEILGVK